MCLKGAAKSIKKWKPKLTICAYHKPEDLYTLAQYVKSLRDDYEFAFRHYRLECHNNILKDFADGIILSLGLELLVPTDYEMVLYCR